MDQKLISILDQFKNKKVLVIGDLMLDKYIWGEVSRVSPEAPVQVVKVSKESYAPGGAANVANNVAALNGKTYMIGLVGNDEANETLISELKKKQINTEGIIEDNNRPTIQKIRVIGKGQQLLRFDYEKKDYLDEGKEKKILDFVIKRIQNIDAIIISDYAKGVITKNLAEKLIKLANEKKKIIIIDPKPEHKKFYKNATLITPNNKEACEMLNVEEKNDDSINKVGKRLLEELNAHIVITKGEKGIAIFEKNSEITNIPTKAKEVYDIIGAGDTVVATLALALASNATLKEAAILANYAAGITVGKVGTSTVTTEEIKKAMQDE
ncbi:D-glycero-beta-D-manno-heptose-7-phosphate kinase [Candidatus Woesearchaeota archaeon]|nr:D-glycero-beta-D-manno-heptose-7-phosphate kinase [Candidatus Woesearchaeota archaeon]